MEELSTPASRQASAQIYRPHILNLLLPFIWSVLMLLPLILITISLGNLLTPSPSTVAAIWLFGGLYLIFVLSYFVMNVISWYLDAWLLTSTELVDLQLISPFNRRISELSWNQVQDVRVAIQGILANLFDFGDISVQSAGRQGVFELRSIPHPREVARLINELGLGSQHPSPIAQPDRGPTRPLGEILLQQGSITPTELTLALQEQHQTGKQLGQVLVDHHFISRGDLVSALGHQYHIPSIDLSRYDLESAVVKLMPYGTAVKYHAIPVHRSPDNVLSIAIAQPSDQIMGELMSQFDMPLTFLVADENYIQEAIAGYYLDTDMSVPSTPEFPPDLPSGFEPSNE